LRNTANNLTVKYTKIRHKKHFVLNYYYFRYNKFKKYEQKNSTSCRFFINVNSIEQLWCNLAVVDTKVLSQPKTIKCRNLCRWSKMGMGQVTATFPRNRALNVEVKRMAAM
jgi:hypothetical protein